MNIIWCVLMSVGVIAAVINGRLDAYTAALFEAGKAAVEICLYLLGIVSLWLGLTRMLEDAGLIKRIAGAFRPLIGRLFKSIPEGHPAGASITMNLLANLFGLGNAATPMGIRAMKDLRSLAPDSDEVTPEMMLFIVINTSSIQLIPFTVIGLLADYGSKNPGAIVLPTIIATVISTAAAIGILKVFRRFAQ